MTRVWPTSCNSDHEKIHRESKFRSNAYDTVTIFGRLKRRNQFEKSKCVFPMFGGQEKFNCPTARKWIICALPGSFGYQISTCNSNLLLLTIAPSLVSRNNQMYLAGWVAKQCKTLCPAIFTPRRKQDTWHQNIAAPGRKLSNSREDRKGSIWG